MDQLTFDVLFGDQALPISLSINGTLADLKQMLFDFTGIPINEQMLLNLSDNVRDSTVLASTDLNNLELIQVPAQDEIVQDQFREPEQNIYNQPTPPIPPIHVPPPIQFHDDDDIIDDDDDDDQHIFQNNRYATNYFPNTAGETISISALQEFIDELKYPEFSSVALENYQAIVPEAYRGGFKEALTEARTQGKLVMVYLHSWNNEASLGFTLDILKSEKVYQLITENFIFYVANVTEDVEPLLFSMISFEGYPLVGLVLPSGSARLTSFLQGVQEESTFYNSLLNAIENTQEERDRLASEQRESDEVRMIVEEQDKAYNDSLRLDKEKAEKADREQKEADRKKEEKLARGNRVPAEPEKSKTSTQIIFKLPDDSKVERRFNQTDTIQTLCDYLDGLGCDIETYQFVTQYPKKTFTKSDINQTLLESGIHPQSILNVRDESQ